MSVLLAYTAAFLTITGVYLALLYAHGERDQHERERAPLDTCDEEVDA